MFTLDTTEGFTQDQIDLMNKAVHRLMEAGIEEKSACDIVNNNFNTEGNNTIATLTSSFWSQLNVVKDTQGNQVDMQAARQLMDDDLCEQIHGTVETEQEFFDAYVKAHDEKFGEEFVVN